MARRLARDRIKDLEDKRRFKHLHSRGPQPLGRYSGYHLLDKAKEKRVTEAWLDQAERHLQAACDLFGEERELGTIDVREVQTFAGYLAKRTNRRGRSSSARGARLAMAARMSVLGILKASLWGQREAGEPAKCQPCPIEGQEFLGGW